jgi:hypothetical protein
MPKATRLSRQVAHFEDGELWCTADATPPVSPGGWYFRLHDTPVGWIGPFPTAEAATVAPQGGDPLATARRRLEEWARATAEPGAEPPEEADLAPTPTPSSSPLRSNADRNIALRGEPDGTRRKRVRPADGGGAEKHARVAFVEEDLAARTAGSLGNDTLSPIASGAPSRVPDPLSPQPDQVAARGTGQESAGMQQLVEASSAPRQLAFGFSQSTEAAVSDPSYARLPGGPRRPYRRRKGKSVEQERLPFPERPAGLAKGE